MVVKLRPQWSYENDKPGNDKTGWKRGQVQKWTDGESEFMRSADPAFDNVAYGPSRPNGPWRTSSHLRDPGNLVDHGKGAKGIDSDDDGRVDDGVRG
jgi:hypothetical protein